MGWLHLVLARTSPPGCLPAAALPPRYCLPARLPVDRPPCTLHSALTMPPSPRPPFPAQAPSFKWPPLHSWSRAGGAGGPRRRRDATRRARLRAPVLAPCLPHIFAATPFLGCDRVCTRSGRAESVLCREGLWALPTPPATPRRAPRCGAAPRPRPPVPPVPPCLPCLPLPSSPATAGFFCCCPAKQERTRLTICPEWAECAKPTLPQLPSSRGRRPLTPPSQLMTACLGVR